jgi:hypothetical protein
VSNEEPRKHHYVPQFFLRNFAVDEERKKVTAVRKHGNKAVWAQTSIKSIAFETDFYVHTENGAPVSVETTINRNIETPISNSETWRKIADGAIADLDASDRSVLYSLVRNFEVRTPHYRNTIQELAQLAIEPDSGMQFSDEEQEMYALLGSDRTLMETYVNETAANARWSTNEFYSCGITVCQVSEPTYVCTTPVHPMKVPTSAALHSVQLGLEPVSQLMPLTPNSYIILSLGDFDGSFTNQKVDADVEQGLKRQIVGQFGFWPKIEHMVCPSDGLQEHLEWAGFEIVRDTPNKKIFERNTKAPVHHT